MKVYISISKESRNHKELEALSIRIYSELTKQGHEVLCSYNLSNGKVMPNHEKLKFIQSEIKKSKAFILLLDEPSLRCGSELGFSLALAGKRDLYVVYKRKDKLEEFISAYPFKRMIEWHSDEHVIQNIARALCQEKK